ncbi:SRPBCC family protein [Rhodococcoides kyotonense]|uniref:Carbon monoxide dehydrogenase n=1 Tax=Rhodococcoides kyotonense TaxID=398843 RepID=A0A177Y919_9NOCA|nr:carbon monoxide dehydrogenase subunit G [Rhodococcus kyotonensis]OAK51699.1 carbon monoxide dehydrogenase [Rhodococcus kyotonensis]
MRIAGTAQLTAPREEVYDNLQDGRVLAATIPGVQSLEQLTDNHYKLSIMAGVASIKGVYDGEVVLSQQDRPNSFVMTASGAGAPGTVKADVTVTLTENEQGTLLSYDADAVVGGMVGGVGQRMITGVAKKMAGVFFKSIDGVIANGIPSSTPAATSEVTSSSEAVVEQANQVPRAMPVSGGTDARTVLVSAAAGAVIALTGVVIGGLLGRSR